MDMDAKHRRRRHRSSTRSRSRSPDTAAATAAARSSRHSHSHRHRPHRHHHSDRDSHRDSHRDRDSHRVPAPAPPPAAPITLPFNAPPLTKHALSLPHVRTVFASYLDVQKGLILAELESREEKGRFKRFVSHYNRGELARGWYERVNQPQSQPQPQPQSQAQSQSQALEPAQTEPAESEPKRRRKKRASEDTEDSEDEVVGPFLPGQAPKRSRVGPAIPTVEDLDMQRDLLADDAALTRADLRFERKQDRTQQREALDELLPRAAAGTHERRLEKKAELTDTLRAFRDNKSPGAVEEVDDATLMGGGGEGGTEGFKQKKAALERKKNDRELRKEQLLRARIAEREERLEIHRVKEERTMAMFKTLATRFQ